MIKLIKILLICLLIIAMIIGGALAVGFYKPRTYENLINKVLFDKTGYQYKTEEISIQLSPAKVQIKNFELNNPDWPGETNLLKLDHVDISLNIKNLVNEKKPFWNAVLQGVDAIYVENEKGELNWITKVLSNQSKKDTNEPVILEDLLSFSELNINQANLIQIKPSKKEVLELSVLSIKRTSDDSMQLQGAGLYQQQNVEISGNIEIDGKSATQQLVNFAMQAQGLGVDLKTKGVVNPFDLNNTKISVQAKSENLEKLEMFLDTAFPDVTPLDISLNLQSINNGYELSKIHLQMGENIVTGDLVYNIKDELLNASIVSEKIDLSSFISSQKSNAEKKETNVALLEEQEIDWHWAQSLNTDISLDIDELLLDQHVLKELNASMQVNNAVINIKNLSTSYLYEDFNDTTSSYASDQIKVTGTMQPLADVTLGKDINLSIKVEENGTSFTLMGDANINAIGGSELVIEADISNLDSLQNYLAKDLSPYLPAKVMASVTTKEKQLIINQLIANLNKSDVSGNIEVNWSDEVVRVIGNVNSELMDLTPFLKVQDDAPEKKQKSNTSKIFSDQPIDWTWLNTYDAELQLAVNKLIVEENIFNNLKTNIEIGEGCLNVYPLETKFADGNMQSKLEIKRSGDSVKLNTQLDAINLSLAALGATGDSVLEGGTTDIVMDFSGEGSSLHQIMSSLNGEIIAEVQKGVIKNDAFEAIGTDIVLEMLSMLNPFIKEDETTELECAAVKFTAKDGVLTSNNQLAVETSKMKIVGGGVIDMASEELEIGFSPSAKKGIGVNVGSLVKFVRLGGTLSNPHPEADPVGLLKSGAAIGAAVSTGGLSLLVEGLFKRAAGAGSACNQALQDVNEETKIDNQQSDMDKTIN